MTSSIGKLFIGEEGIFISLIHSTNCFVELAYTIRPKPTQPWAAEHMAQCSPEAYTVAVFLSSRDQLFAAQPAKANPRCCVLSQRAHRLMSSFKTSSSSETRINPIGSSPLSNAISASSTQRSKCL